MLENTDFAELAEHYAEEAAIWRTEGPAGVRNLTKFVGVLGYNSIEKFLEDNPGVVEAIYQWINYQECEEWKENLIAELSAE